MLNEVPDKDLVYTQSKEYALTSVVSDHGIYERKCKCEPYLMVPSSYRLIGDYYYELKLILNSRSNALEIMGILDKDEINHKELQEGKDKIENPLPAGPTIRTV